MTDTDLANLKRDKKLRRFILNRLFASRQEAPAGAPRGGIGAEMLKRVMDDTFIAGNGLEDDNHAITLLIDLRDAGYIEMLDQRTRNTIPYGIGVLFLKITPLGSKLCREEIAPDPMIEDERDMSQA